MCSRFDIKVSAGPAYDGETEAEAFTLLFSTKGRVKVSEGLATRESQAGARTVVTVMRQLHIPVDSPDVPVGAVAFCTSTGNTSDPQLAGAQLRLDGAAPGDQTTARRLQVSEVIA